MKRVLAVLVAVGAALCLRPDAQAKSLEEILKDKGVITEEDYKEATKKSDLAYYKPGRGITVESEDGAFAASVGGRLQARYEYVATDDPDGEDESSFSIRRMKFWLQGHVFRKELSYKWQQNFGGGGSELEDAWLAYDFHEAFGLTLGQQKPPQARQELTSSGSQQFVDRSLANDTFNLGYDIGLQASGSFAGGKVEYGAGIFNGNGENEANPTTDHMFALRLDVNPFGPMKRDEVAWNGDKPLLNIGGSYAFIPLTDDDAGSLGSSNEIFDKALNIDGFNQGQFLAAFGEELDISVFTVNLHGQWKGASLGAEYYSMTAEPDLGDDLDADGYYVQAGYMIVPKTFEVAARYSAIDSDYDGQRPEFDRAETQVAANYYLVKHNAKLQADYTMVKDDENDGSDDNILRVQAQLIF